ncbi:MULTISPECIES: aminotransferase class I/II-fold pyridoxal phosphate-dependent enzyme [unclassified Iodidimonas]|uniref:serine palmitoyltransferase n=1 Tax=unclassified Iodidimonas TaxID=2626145 RepID=UPI002482EF32|nr:MULTISPECIES: aminotransferase class I/II-fold pyridoxal phosphate-dependent enzyme [unclassified Iodidimonas]
MDLLDKFDPLIAERARMGDSQPDPLNIVMDEMLSATEAMIGGRKIILAGTNNYMGMTFDPDAIEAAKDALDAFGTGTTGSRILNGTYQGHKALEQALMDFYGMDHAMVFTTGYQANLGMISTLAGRGDYVIIDADSHASIYDACAMGNADVLRFRHNSVEDLEKRLKRLPAESAKLVVLEGIYSMLGDRAPLRELIAVAKAAGAQVLVDEAHSMGFCGETGRGVAQELGVEDQVDFIVGTFSKSVGTVGGFCLSNHPKFEVLRFACRPYMFTASLPPSVVASAISSIRSLKNAHNKRAHLWGNVERLHSGLKNLGFNLGTESVESPIVAVCLETQDQLFGMCRALLLEGVYVNVARPPATPTGLYLLRCSLGAGHSADQVDRILEAFKAAAHKLQLPLNEKPRAASASENAKAPQARDAAVATG